MKFRVNNLRLQKSHAWGGYYLAIDFDDNVSTGIKIPKKRYLELTELVKRKFPSSVIE